MNEEVYLLLTADCGWSRKRFATWATQTLLDQLVTTQDPPQVAAPVAAAADRRRKRDYARSKRSRFMTLSHAATKSCTNFSFESSHA